MMAAGLMDWFNTLGPGNKIAALAILTSAVCFLAWVAAHYYRRVRDSAERAQTLRTMVERGLSSDEIMRLMLASQLMSPSTSDETLDPEDDPEAYVVKCLTDAWYSGNDIQRILAAARGNGKIDLTAVRMIESLANGWTGTKAIVQLLESQKQQPGQAGAEWSGA